MIPTAEIEGREGNKNPARRMVYLAGNDNLICGDEHSPYRDENPVRTGVSPERKDGLSTGRHGSPMGISKQTANRRYQLLMEIRGCLAEIKDCMERHQQLAKKQEQLAEANEQLAKRTEVFEQKISANEGKVHEGFHGLMIEFCKTQINELMNRYNCLWKN